MSEPFYRFSVLTSNPLKPSGNKFYGLGILLKFPKRQNYLDKVKSHWCSRFLLFHCVQVFGSLLAHSGLCTYMRPSLAIFRNTLYITTVKWKQSTVIWSTKLLLEDGAGKGSGYIQQTLQWQQNTVTVLMVRFEVLMMVTKKCTVFKSCTFMWFSELLWRTTLQACTLQLIYPTFLFWRN
jgi:hypothetical protein